MLTVSGAIIGGINGRVARFIIATVSAVVIVALAAASAQAALVFLFSPTSVRPGDRVVVRTGGTPLDFELGERVRPLQEPIQIYLVPNSLAHAVHSRSDPRLVRVATLVPDKNGHGLVAFTLPNLETNTYAAAAWCPGCAPYSKGRTFFVLGVGDDILPQYRPLMLLRVRGVSGSSEGEPLAKDSSGRWPLVIGLATGASLLLVSAAVLFLLRRRKQAPV